MTSVQDVFDQLVAVNTNLGNLHNDMVAEIGATQAVQQAVTQVDSTLATGFTVLAQGMAVLAQLEEQEIQLLAHLSHQADTEICELEHISRNTCSLLNESYEQTRLLRLSATAVSALEQMYETVHADAALTRARLEALQARIEACCPPPVEDPPCRFEPCPAPKPIDEGKFPRPEVPQFPAKQQIG
jgi:molybdenum cofactor biosynthesis enzyme MoaA